MGMPSWRENLIPLYNLQPAVLLTLIRGQELCLVGWGEERGAKFANTKFAEYQADSGTWLGSALSPAGLGSQQLGIIWTRGAPELYRCPPDTQ